ncbi:MAG: dienelactone hydrolase family protein, partial [Rubrivivax sp.]
MLDAELDTPATAQDLIRRSFITGAVGSGFAAAVLPVTAQSVVNTPFDGMVAGEVTIPSGGFAMPAYRAMPAGKQRLPVVLVVSEIFGVHEHIADVARRFA